MTAPELPESVARSIEEAEAHMRSGEPMTTLEDVVPAPTTPEPAPWSPEDAVAALTALCAVYETKPRAWRAIPTELVREVISGERRA